MTETNLIIIYATDWCGDCRRAKRLLTQNNIPYKWVNIDLDREAEAFVIKTNRGNRSVPTILFPDGSILVEPSTAQLSEKLCLPVP